MRKARSPLLAKSGANRETTSANREPEIELVARVTCVRFVVADFPHTVSR